MFSVSLNNLIWGIQGTLIILCIAAVWSFPLIAVKKGFASRGNTSSRSGTSRISILKNTPGLLVLSLIGFGLSLSNTVEAVKALLSNRIWPFRRTPKYAIRNRPDNWKDKIYQVKPDIIGLIEMVCGLFGIIAVIMAIKSSKYLLIPFLFVYIASFFFVSILTFFQKGKKLRS